MMNFAFHRKKMQNIINGASSSVSSLQKKNQEFWRGASFLMLYCYQNIVFRINPFFSQNFYFLSISTIGFGVLKALKPRGSDFRPRNLDLFFTSVSATTVSSMTTVEMEVFSNAQLLVITLLMFVGGEVFLSMVELLSKRSNFFRTSKSGIGRRVTSSESDSSSSAVDAVDQIELTIITMPQPTILSRFDLSSNIFNKPFIKDDSIKFLGLMVAGYFFLIQIFGVVCVLVYVSVISSVKTVLREKGLHAFTFALFTIVSTFASCGFVPTNEDMMVFGKNTGLLLILIPQVLLGNTLFPSALRFCIWVLGKKYKKEEAKYLLKHTLDIGYKHLLPGFHSLLLMATVFGFILIGLVLLCAIEWHSTAFGELNSYQKVVGAFFQSVNARHTGETIVDLSTIAPAIMVFFIVMMYLPPYTSFLPVQKYEGLSEHNESRKKRVGENLILSQLSYLAIFIVLLCITERRSLRDDPVNFSIFNIAFEVISAYGNVGFTTGYSCNRQLTRDSTCVDKWYGFAGKWSDEGKLILIVVMFFGRLKKFNMNGGRAWKLQ